MDLDGFTNWDLLRELMQICKKNDKELLKYVIAREHHQDGNIHFHAYIELDEPIKKRGCLFLIWS